MKSDWGYWMGWIVAAVVSALSILVLGVSLFLKGTICTGDPAEQCVREWVSASGGWAAVPAAVLTIAFLSHQISRAERHHRENIGLQVEFKYEIAEGLAPACRAVNRDIDEVHRAVESQDEEAFRSATSNFLSGLLQTYCLADGWDEFERVFVYPGPHCVSDVRQALQDASGVSEPPNSCVTYPGSLLNRALETVYFYNENVGAACDRYISRVNRMLL